ncbi:helix-turn-helix domain-containing protein [Nocardia sp. NPDC059246]|uniref:helix-turn-helix domain-containing protein n=1 Tax=unclassified Nocardia TaxID=2637762 RepID=UPI0036B77B60
MDTTDSSAETGNGPEGSDDAEAKRVDKVLGLELRAQRVRRGLSQEKLAELIGMNKKTVGRLESGDRPITMQHMVKIYKAVGIMPSDLVKALQDELGIEQ